MMLAIFFWGVYSFESKKKNQIFRAVGTGGAQGHVPPQYLEQLVVVSHQYFQKILGLSKWVPPQ